MPTIPFNSPYMSGYGFKFDFVDAFNETATAQGIPINTSFSTLQTSLGSSNDLFPTQQTAWGRANQGVTSIVTLTTPNALGEVGTFNDTPSTNTSLWAYAKQAYITASGGSVPPGSFSGETIVWDGAAWAISGNSLRLGRMAGESTQNIYATALGVEAGRYAQASLATAVGYEAGESNQGTKAIAIGNQAGQVNQGVNAIAIGTLAGATNQHDNTIVLNASGAAFSSGQPGALYINPIRNDNANPNWLTYNNMSGEVTFDSALHLSLGSSNDAPSLTSSVWAYAQQAEADAQFGMSNAATANAWITTESTPNGVNALGTYTDTPGLTTSLWAYAQQAEADAQAAQTVASAAANSVGALTDTPSISTTAFAYAKQAELDAQKASMIWDIDSPALSTTTVCNLSPPYTWTTTYQLIRTITITIPAGWVPRNSTLPTLFMWTIFGSGNHTVLQYFTYDVGAGEQPLAQTAAARPYVNQGQFIYTPITGVMTGVPLAAGDILKIRIYGRLTSGSHAMTNPTDTAFGVLSTGF